jgi:hypothetical protein
MLRADGAEKHFFRRSGVYRHQASGHINRYQIFLERAITLTRPGGRIGLVLPSGFATDHTSALLRRELLTHTNVDTITGFDNRKAIFPIHRSVRFLVCTATAGNNHRSRSSAGSASTTPPSSKPFRTPAIARLAPSHPIVLTPAFLADLDARKLAIPELRASADLRILDRIVHTIRRLDASDGWNVTFGRELNATDDRVHFHSRRGGMPVLEGKHIEPFGVHVDQASARIAERTAARLLGCLRHILASQARLSRCRELDQSPLADRGDPAGGRHHDAFAVLPEDTPVGRQPGLPLRHAQQLRRELSRAPGHDHASRLGNGRSAPGAEAAVRVAAVSRRCRALARVEAFLLACGLHARPGTGRDLLRPHVGEFEHVLETFPLVGETERRATLDEFRRQTLLE